jgi:hypothetical protein
MTSRDFVLVGVYFCGMAAGFLFAYGLRGLYAHYRDWRYGDVCWLCGRKVSQ